MIFSNPAHLTALKLEIFFIYMILLATIIYQYSVPTFALVNYNITIPSKLKLKLVQVANLSWN